ncbi:hypothetical protein [Ekhidna sp.]
MRFRRDGSGYRVRADSPDEGGGGMGFFSLKNFVDASLRSA